MSPTTSINSDGKLQHNDVDESGRERVKRKHRSHRDDACGRNDRKKRRHSTEKAARDSRDEPESATPRKLLNSDGKETKSPSSVMVFDGSSRPSTSYLLRPSHSYTVATYLFVFRHRSPSKT